MSIYATKLTIRAVCRTCGLIHEEEVEFDEPIPVEDLETAAHEEIDKAGFANGECEECLLKPIKK